MRYKKEDVWALTLHLFILFFFLVLQEADAQ